MIASLSNLGTAFDWGADAHPQLRLISGPLVVVQAVLRRWLSPPGSLWYDESYGAGLLQYLERGTPAATIAAYAARHAELDPRVAGCDCTAERQLDGSLTITATVSIDGASQYDFVVKMSQITTELITAND